MFSMRRYGLGLLKFKDEDLHVAAIYFSYAMRINNSNPVGNCFQTASLRGTLSQTIMVHNAVTLARLGNINSARRLYMRALAICPTHVMGRYHLAQLHYYLYADIALPKTLTNHCSKDFRSCIALCEELLEECPREANIYVLMGKVHFVSLSHTILFIPSATQISKTCLVHCSTTRLRMTCSRDRTCKCICWRHSGSIPLIRRTCASFNAETTSV